MPCIINYPIEVSTVVFVLCPLRLYSPHLFENFIWIFLFILSCLVAPRLEELHSYCRQGKLDTSVRAVPCRNCRLIQQNSRCGQKMCKSASAARRALNWSFIKCLQSWPLSGGWTTVGMGVSQQLSPMTKPVCWERICLQNLPALPMGGRALHS